MRNKILNLTFVFVALISLIYSSTSAGQEEYTFLYSWPTGHGLGRPYDVAVDSSGNIYAADGENHRILKLAQDGNVLLEWGTGGTGDGQFSAAARVAVARDGNVYVTDRAADRVQVFRPE